MNKKKTGVTTKEEAREEGEEGERRGGESCGKTEEKREGPLRAEEGRGGHRSLIQPLGGVRKEKP